VFTDFRASANFTRCTFERNTATQSGSAWFGFGTTPGVTAVTQNSSFVNGRSSCCYASGYGYNVENTVSGTASDNSYRTCADTDSGVGGADCCYSKKQYRDGTNCLDCIDGADCSAVGSSVATQALKAGFWRNSNLTTDIRACKFAAACNHTTASATSVSRRTAATAAAASTIVDADTVYCSKGYEGPCKCTLRSSKHHVSSHVCTHLTMLTYSFACVLNCLKYFVSRSYRLCSVC
jgi:hypothetical protein